MILNDWIPTHIFLGYAPNEELEKEIFDKAIEVGTAWKKNKFLLTDIFTTIFSK